MITGKEEKRGTGIVDKFLAITFLKQPEAQFEPLEQASVFQTVQMNLLKTVPLRIDGKHLSVMAKLQLRLGNGLGGEPKPEWFQGFVVDQVDVSDSLLRSLRLQVGILENEEQCPVR